MAAFVPLLPAFATPKIPAIPNIEMPKPLAPGKGPVNVSETAGMERARIASRGRGKGTAGLVLSPLGVTSEPAIKRTTLLGV